MILVIVDSEQDEKNIYRKYPYPMQLLNEDSEYLTVINNNAVQKIKKRNHKFYKIAMSDKEYKKIT